MIKIRHFLKKFSIQKGFTIIELIIYMGILTILLSVLTALLTSALDVQLSSQSTSSVEQDGRYIVTRLTYDIQRAQTIFLPATQGTQGNVLQININSDNHNYSIDGNQDIQLVNSIGTYMLNSFDSRVSEFLVTRIGNVGGLEDTIVLSFTLIGRTIPFNGNEETKQFQTTIALRRK